MRFAAEARIRRGPRRKAIESLIARNALSLRIAANGALAAGAGDPCARAQRSLAIAPAVAQRFELETATGQPLCKIGDIGDTGVLPVVAPGDIGIRVAPDADAIVFRTGVNGGMATGELGIEELRSAAGESGGAIESMILRDGDRVLRVIGPPAGPDLRMRMSEFPIGNGNLIARIGTAPQRITTLDRAAVAAPGADVGHGGAHYLAIGHPAADPAAPPAPARGHPLRAGRSAQSAEKAWALDRDPGAARRVWPGGDTGSMNPSAKWPARSRASAAWSGKSITA